MNLSQHSATDTLCNCGGPPSLPIVPTLSEKWKQNFKIVCENGCSLEVRNMDGLNFGKDKFQVVLDCRGFLSSEINCTVLIDQVFLTAEHSSGGRTTKLSRSYNLPESFDPNLAMCQFSEDGIAVITVPWLQ